MAVPHRLRFSANYRRYTPEMAAALVRISASLGEIRGVGPMKIDKYGERFLQLVRTSDETEAA